MHARRQQISKVEKENEERCDPMSLEENKAIFRRFIEAYNEHNLDLLDDLVAPNYVDPDYPQLNGLEGLKQMMRMASRRSLITMRLLRISLLKGIKCGFF